MSIRRSGVSVAGPSALPTPLDGEPAADTPSGIAGAAVDGGPSRDDTTPRGYRNDQRGDEGQGPRAPASDRRTGAGAPANDRRRGVLRRHPAPGLGRAGGPRAGREAPAGPAHRVVRGRRAAHRLEKRAPAEDRRGTRRLRALQGEVMPERVTDLAAPVRGMHCAACVGKVERALTSVPGVDRASVNLATERASVSFDPALTSVDALRAAVAAAGYELAEPRPEAGPSDDAEQAAREADQRRQRTRLVVGALLSAPVLLGGMAHLLPWVPAVLQDPWVLLILTTPVQFWVGWQFHRGFLRDLRYRNESMSTLVSVGTNAAYFFSVAVTLWPHAFPQHGAMTYYDVSAVVITLVVLGRWLEARARGRTSEAIRRLVSLAPRTARAVRALRPHGRGGRARHRMPVRHGAGDTDRDHGRHRPRRRARDSGQERHGARAAGSGDHGRVRQDRDADGRPPRGH